MIKKTLILKFIGGMLNLELFFIISGFNMGLILNKKYIFLQNYIIILFFILILLSYIIKTPGIWNHIINWFIYILAIFIIPFLFIKTKNNKIDRNIGEISYPVYLINLLIINIIVYINLGDVLNQFKTLIIIFLSIIISIILVKYIDIPINKIRQKNITKLIE